MKAEETFDFQVRWAWFKIARIYNTIAQDYGMTMSVGYILLNIGRNGTPSTSLGPMMGMEPRSLTRTLKRMEEEELICRKNDKSDKRKVLILLTEKGKKKRDEARSVVMELNNLLIDKISKKEREQFFKLMNKINGILDVDKIVKEVRG